MLFGLVLVFMSEIKFDLALKKSNILCLHLHNCLIQVTVHTREFSTNKDRHGKMAVSLTVFVMTPPKDTTSV